ncbi:hypothetical protein V2J09_012816 [Rumex salicifolius]
MLTLRTDAATTALHLNFFYPPPLFLTVRSLSLSLAACHRHLYVLFLHFLLAALTPFFFFLPQSISFPPSTPPSPDLAFIFVVLKGLVCLTFVSILEGESSFLRLLCSTSPLFRSHNLQASRTTARLDRKSCSDARHCLALSHILCLISPATVFSRQRPQTGDCLLSSPFKRSCKKHRLICQIQTQLFINGLQDSRFVVPKLIAQCADSKNMGYARRVFDVMAEPNDVVYNTMFKGYTQNEEYDEAVSLFLQMIELNVKPSCYTFPMVLKSCAKVLALGLGQEVHCGVIKNGLKSNPFVGTTLIEMYSNCGKGEEANKVFSEMPLRNVVAWTSLINGLISCGDIKSARGLFELAPERDMILWNTMISGYTAGGDMVMARELFSMMPKKDVMIWNTMLSGYLNNGNIEACKNLFEEMQTRNVFSWNILINGLARNGLFFEVLRAFKRMLADSEVQANDATLVTVLSACARLGALDFGKWLHVYAESIGYKQNVYVANALMDMYAKCGFIENAVNLFKGLLIKDVISWNTMIGGLAMHGRGADALDLFAQMKTDGMKPDGITFVSVLCACTHLGLVQSGLAHFYSMADYSVNPQIEHYGCIIDLCARASLLDRAMGFVNTMPMKPDGVIWASLLGACRIHKNIELAERALKHLIELEPGNPANYVLLSNIYGEAGKWERVSELQVAMRDTRSRKVPGCSLIEVDDRVVEFYSLDERHPEKEEIYYYLASLTHMLRSYKEFDPTELEHEA